MREEGFGGCFSTIIEKKVGVMVEKFKPEDEYNKRGESCCFVCALG